MLDFRDPLATTDNFRLDRTVSIQWPPLTDMLNLTTRKLCNWIHDHAVRHGTVRQWWFNWAIMILSKG